MMAEPQFTERQVLAILRKASEYQAAGASSTVDGLSSEQVRAMAIDLGISPEAIDMALRTGAEPAESSWMDKLLGAPVACEVDRTFEGEVNAEVWAEYVHTLRKTFGVNGTIGTVGNAYEWTAGDRELIGAMVSATGKNGRTRLRATTEIWGALFLSGLITGVAMLFGVSGVLSWSGAAFAVKLVLAGLLATAIFLGFRHVVGGMARRRRDALTQATAEFESALASRQPALESSPAADPLRARVRKGKKEATGEDEAQQSVS